MGSWQGGHAQKAKSQDFRPLEVCIMICVSTKKAFCYQIIVNVLSWKVVSCGPAPGFIVSS